MAVADARYLSAEVTEPLSQHVAQTARENLVNALSKITPSTEACIAVLLRLDPVLSRILSGFGRELDDLLIPEMQRALASAGVAGPTGMQRLGPQAPMAQDAFSFSDANAQLAALQQQGAGPQFAFPNAFGGAGAGSMVGSGAGLFQGGAGKLDMGALRLNDGGASALSLSNAVSAELLRMQGQQQAAADSFRAGNGLSPGAGDKYQRTPMFAGAPGRPPLAPGRPQQPASGAGGMSMPLGMHWNQSSEASSALDAAAASLGLLSQQDLAGQLNGLQLAQGQQQQQQGGNAIGQSPADVAANLMGFHGYIDGSAVVTASQERHGPYGSMGGVGQQVQARGSRALSSDGSELTSHAPSSGYVSPHHGLASGGGDGAGHTGAPAGPEHQHQQPGGMAIPSQHGLSPISPSPVTSSPASSVASSSSLLHNLPHFLAQQQAQGKSILGQPQLSMAAKLQQATAALAAAGPGMGMSAANAAALVKAKAAGMVAKPPPDMPPRFRVLPPAVQCKIHALTKDNHVVLLKDFDEKVLSKVCLLCDKFGPGECLAMLDRIEEVLKGKAGRLANGPGYLDVSVSTRLDELKQRCAGQVTAPEDYARSTLHSRIYGELRSLVDQHSFLTWDHFDQGIVNMLKKMPNNVAVERLSELRYHSFKNVENAKSCIVSILTTKPKYSPGVMGAGGALGVM